MQCNLLRNNKNLTNQKSRARSQAHKKGSFYLN